MPMTGAGQSRTRRNSVCSMPSGAKGSTPRARAPMSKPALQTVSLGPARRMTARVAGGRPSKAPISPSSIAAPSALRRAGSCMRMLATLSSRVTETGTGAV